MWPSTRRSHIAAIFSHHALLIQLNVSRSPTKYRQSPSTTQHSWKHYSSNNWKPHEPRQCQFNGIFGQERKGLRAVNFTPQYRILPYRIRGTFSVIVLVGGIRTSRSSHDSHSRNSHETKYNRNHDETTTVFNFLGIGRVTPFSSRMTTGTWHDIPHYQIIDRVQNGTNRPQKDHAFGHDKATIKDGNELFAQVDLTHVP